MIENYNGKPMDQVPEPVRHLYDAVDVEEQKKDENGELVWSTKEVGKYNSQNELIDLVEVKEPVMIIRRVAQLKPQGETKTEAELFNCINHHKGKNDRVVQMFIQFYLNKIHYEFHDEYVDWVNAGGVGEAPNQPIMDIEAWMYQHYKELRHAAYPPQDKQFEMQFDDMANGTHKWTEAIVTIKRKYPKFGEHLPMLLFRGGF